MKKVPPASKTIFLFRANQEAFEVQRLNGQNERLQAITTEFAQDIAGLKMVLADQEAEKINMALYHQEVCGALPTVCSTTPGRAAGYLGQISPFTACTARHKAYSAFSLCF